jgi:hypothetical protein
VTGFHVQRPAPPADTKSVNVRIVLMILSLAAAIAAGAEGLDSEDLPDRRERRSWQSFDPEDYGEGWLTLDRNDDGVVDYAVMVNDNGQKMREAVDFNRDGAMDDFYFYENDVLVRQEIDTNYDRRIDAWVYLRRGVYITMWERDRDYDGIIDDRERYGGE